VYGYSAPNYCTVTRWFNEFKRGCQSLEDDPHSGRPSDLVHPISIAAVEKLIRANRRVKVSEIVKELQIAAGSTENIIDKHLHTSKVSSRWLSQNLSLHHQFQGVASCQELLDLYTSE